MNPFWNPLVDRLSPYVPGEQPLRSDFIKLNTNENPYPPSPRAVAAMREELGEDGARLRLYPDPDAKAMKTAVAAFFSEFSLSVNQVFVGNGSDEVLAIAFLALLKHDRPILLPDVTYSFYPVYCGLYGIAFTTVPLDAEFQVNIDDYRLKNGGIVLANPNAPTGCLLPVEEIGRLADIHPCSVLLVDEAYVDFAGETTPTAIALVKKHANILVVRTLSKSHALAGLRVGYAVGDEKLIEALDRVKNSFNSFPLDRLAIVAAAAAIGDAAYLEKTRAAVMKSRKALFARLVGMGFDVLPSASNFLFARHPRHDARAILLALRERGILVRHFDAPRTAQYLRISVGTNAQCGALIEALSDILGAAR
ncbi:MAG: histidinol-phosphate transaminase [Candidatus Accumulibacter sp.]|jgi:histidinol-phosphate aminotransferase|nr:histidinol-phosphate transaminase [Accumulibacter sp.]